MNSEALTIRPAGQDDLEAMVLLLQQLFAIEKDFEPDADRQHRGLQRFLDGCGKHRAILVAEMDARVVGMATIQILISTAQGGPVGLVEDVVVLDDYRGQGIGRRLMAALSKWAAQRRLSRMQLLADRGNEPALAFYHSIGWQSTQLVCLRSSEDKILDSID